MENSVHVTSQSGFPAIGAGTTTSGGDFENQLIEAPEEEEEFDILNDETFGHCEDGGDFDWEVEHERLAEGLEGESFFDFQQKDITKLSKDSGYGNAERSYRSQEEYLEQSITRLVVEDEEEEERRTFFGRGQPIPTAKGPPHLDELFGPSSPPALLDEHLVTHSSKNIWGSPVESVFHKPANALRKLFETAKGGYGSGMESHILGAHPTMTPQSPAPLPQALTLEEIERRMLSRGGKQPQILTAAELERQMHGESAPAPHPPVSQMVSQHPQRPLPHHQGSGAHLPPGLLSASLLAGDHRSPYPMAMHPIGQPPPGTPPHRLPLGLVPMSQPPVSNGRSSPIPILASGKMLPQSMVHGGSPQLTPGHTGSPVGRSASTPTPPLIPGVTSLLRSPHPRLMSPYNVVSINGPAPMGLGNRMMGPPPGVHGPIPHGPMPSSPMGTPPGSRMGVLHGMQDMSHHPQVHHHHVRSMPHPSASTSDRRHDLNNLQHGSRMPQTHMDKNQAYRTNYQRPPPWQQHHHHQQQDAAEDEYEGLMTRREKDWIIKIQLLQLNTDNPYLDDYYYTYYTLRKKQRESGSGDADNLSLKLLIPNIAKIETRAYTPAQFEGSLGRLTTASVHNPRHIIDVTRGSSPTEDSSKKNVSKELRKFRQLLMDIEKGYVLLLDVDDIEKKVFALPEENRLPLFIERHEKIGQLYQYFTCDESIEQYTQILGVRKGRKLLGRVLPLLSKNQAHVALCILFHHMHHLVKKDTPDEGLSVLTKAVCTAMEGSDLESLVRLVNVLKGEKPAPAGIFLHPLFRNQFSASVLCCLLQQAEQLFQETSPVDLDNQLQTEWNMFVEEFAEGLQGVPLKDLPRPPGRLPLVEPQLSHVLNAQLMGRLEDKLHHLTTPADTTSTTSNSAASS